MPRRGQQRGKKQGNKNNKKNQKNPKKKKKLPKKKQIKNSRSSNNRTSKSTKNNKNNNNISTPNVSVQKNSSEAIPASKQLNKLKQKIFSKVFKGLGVLLSHSKYYRLGSHGDLWYVMGRKLNVRYKSDTCEGGILKYLNSNKEVPKMVDDIYVSDLDKLKQKMLSITIQSINKKLETNYSTLPDELSLLNDKIDEAAKAIMKHWAPLTNDKDTKISQNKNNRKRSLSNVKKETIVKNETNNNNNKISNTPNAKRRRFNMNNSTVKIKKENSSEIYSEINIDNVSDKSESPESMSNVNLLNDFDNNSNNNILKENNYKINTRNIKRLNTVDPQSPLYRKVQKDKIYQKLHKLNKQQLLDEAVNLELKYLEYRALVKSLQNTIRKKSEDIQKLQKGDLIRVRDDVDWNNTGTLRTKAKNVFNKFKGSLAQCNDRSKIEECWKYVVKFVNDEYGYECLLRSDPAQLSVLINDLLKTYYLAQKDPKFIERFYVAYVCSGITRNGFDILRLASQYRNIIDNKNEKAITFSKPEHSTFDFCGVDVPIRSVPPKYLVVDNGKKVFLDNNSFLTKVTGDIHGIPFEIAKFYNAPSVIIPSYYDYYFNDENCKYVFALNKYSNKWDKIYNKILSHNNNSNTKIKIYDYKTEIYDNECKEDIPLEYLEPIKYELRENDILHIWINDILHLKGDNKTMSGCKASSVTGYMIDSLLWDERIANSPDHVWDIGGIGVKDSHFYSRTMIELINKDIKSFKHNLEFNISDKIIVHVIPRFKWTGDWKFSATATCTLDPNAKNFEGKMIFLYQQPDGSIKKEWPDKNRIDIQWRNAAWVHAWERNNDTLMRQAFVVEDVKEFTDKIDNDIDVWIDNNWNDLKNLDKREFRKREIKEKKRLAKILGCPYYEYPGDHCIDIDVDVLHAILNVGWKPVLALINHILIEWDDVEDDTVKRIIKEAWGSNEVDNGILRNLVKYLCNAIDNRKVGCTIDCNVTGNILKSVLKNLHPLIVRFCELVTPNQPVRASTMAYYVVYCENIALFAFISFKSSFDSWKDEWLSIMDSVGEKLFHLTCAVQYNALRPYSSRAFRLLPKAMISFAKETNGKGLICISQHSMEHALKQWNRILDGHNNNLGQYLIHGYWRRAAKTYGASKHGLICWSKRIKNHKNNNRLKLLKFDRLANAWGKENLKHMVFEDLKWKIPLDTVDSLVFYYINGFRDLESNCDGLYKKDYQVMDDDPLFKWYFPYGRPEDDKEEKDDSKEQKDDSKQEKEETYKIDDSKPFDSLNSHYNKSQAKILSDEDEIKKLEKSDSQGSFNESDVDETLFY